MVCVARPVIFSTDKYCQTILRRNNVLCPADVKNVYVSLVIIDESDYRRLYDP